MPSMWRIKLGTEAPRVREQLNRLDYCSTRDASAALGMTF